jgi:hypothetical protein
MYVSSLLIGYLITPSILKYGGPLPAALLFASVLVVTLNLSAVCFGFKNNFVMIALLMKKNEIKESVLPVFIFGKMLF